MNGDLNIDIMDASSLKQIVENSVNHKRQETPSNDDEGMFEDEYKVIF